MEKETGQRNPQDEIEETLIESDEAEMKRDVAISMQFAGNEPRDTVGAWIDRILRLEGARKMNDSGRALITELKKEADCVPHAKMLCESFREVLDYVDKRDVGDLSRQIACPPKTEEDFAKELAAMLAVIAADFVLFYLRDAKDRIVKVHSTLLVVSGRGQELSVSGQKRRISATEPTPSIEPTSDNGRSMTRDSDYKHDMPLLPAPMELGRHNLFDEEKDLVHFNGGTPESNGYAIDDISGLVMSSHRDALEKFNTTLQKCICNAEVIEGNGKESPEYKEALCSLEAELVQDPLASSEPKFQIPGPMFSAKRNLCLYSHVTSELQKVDRNGRKADGMVRYGALPDARDYCPHGAGCPLESYELDSQGPCRSRSLRFRCAW
jgi:hypothetical protein